MLGPAHVDTTDGREQLIGHTYQSIFIQPRVAQIPTFFKKKSPWMMENTAVYMNSSLTITLIITNEHNTCSLHVLVYHYSSKYLVDIIMKQ